MNKDKLYCPFCKREFKTILALKVHVKKYHKLHGYCPICNRKFERLLSHFMYQALSDKEHTILYYLYCDIYDRNSNLKKYARSVATAYLCSRTDAKKLVKYNVE